MRPYYFYILASHSRRLYVGITNDLPKRIYEHRTSTAGFTAKYRIHRLVYYEQHRHPMNAITREKQIKRWVRRKKIELIERQNGGWIDLSEGWLDNPLERSE